jgi:hypothetical protein
LQLDFGERDQRKSVTIVDLVPGKPVELREIPISSGRKLSDVAGTMDELAAFENTKESAYLRVTLKCQGPQPGLADEVRERLPNAIEIRLDYPRTQIDTIPTLRGLSAREQFARYFATRHEASPSEEMLDLFDGLIEKAGAP